MKLKYTVLAALASTLPLAGAMAQQWTTNALPSGLIAWWQAEGNMLDSVGNHNGSGSTAPTYAPGRFGQAFQFNGTDQSVSIPDSYADLDSWTQFTLEAWFNADIVTDAPTPGRGRAIFSKVGNPSNHSDYNQGYQLSWNGDGTKIVMYFNQSGQPWPGNVTAANLNTPLLTNSWYHIVATYDHNAVMIYLNGVPLVTNIIGAVTLQNSSSSLRISKDDNLNAPFAGRIDDARIYNRALTAAEVAYLYQGPQPPVITSATSATGQVGLIFSYQITANNSPTLFGASGLPSGLTVNTNTGLIAGVPAASGSFSAQVMAANPGGTSTAPLSITILPGTGGQWSTNNLPSGLIAWWQAESNMLDSVGGHNGTGSTAPTYAPGRFGQAFRFNGVDQSVAIPDSYGDLDSWTQFTLEAWFNLDTTSDYLSGRGILSKVGNVSDHANYNQGYQIALANNASQIDLHFNQSGQAWPGFSTHAKLGASLLTNTWYHLVGTYDHNAVKIYLNGALLTNNVVGPATLQNSSSSLRISKDDNLNVPFAGRIDDARIYNRALTAAEVAYLYQGPTLPVTSGLKLRFDAGNVNGDGSIPASGASVTTWRDLSGNAIDATSAGFAAPVYHTNVLNGHGGVDFGASGSDALATAFSSQLNFTNCTILMVANGANTGTHISISAATLMQEFCIYDKGIQHHSSPFHYAYLSHQNTPSGFYLHAALFGVKASQTGSLINGVASTSGFVLGQQSPTLADVADYTPINRQALLGWRNSNAYGGTPAPSENFNGMICEVLVYDRQLNAAELDAMNFYLAGKYGIAVTAIPPLLQVQLVSTITATLNWASTAGRTYQLQTTTNLPATSWQNLGTPFPGTGGVLTTNLPVAQGPAKYFRLQVSN